MMRLVVYGEPKAQKRHRHARLKESNFIKTYDPSSDDKDDLLWQVINHKPAKPFDQPLKVSVHAFFSRPKSHFGTGRNKGKLKRSAPIYHTSKPDRDNLDKFVLDALTGVFFTDDKIVCDGRIVKKYSTIPRLEIFIQKL